MKIEFSKHAKERLKQRKISVKLVKSALSSPNIKIDSFRQRELFQLKLDDRILEVVVTVENNKLLVITAYYL